jgi:hypothetical protein
MVDIPFKNKGILVVLFLIVWLVLTAVVGGELYRSVGGIFSKIDFYSILGIALLPTAVCTWFIRYDYYKDKHGNKKRMDTVHELLYIPLRIWVYILPGLSLVLLGNSLFHYFPAFG